MWLRRATCGIARSAGEPLYTEYPSNQVPYSYYVNGGSSASSSTYYTLSGTSMAAGVVSGVVADLLQKSPQLNPDQVKARLMKTAWKALPSQSSVVDPTTGITTPIIRHLYDWCGLRRRGGSSNSTDVANATAMSPTANFRSEHRQCLSVVGPFRGVETNPRCGAAAQCGALHSS